MDVGFLASRHTIITSSLQERPLIFFLCSNIISRCCLVKILVATAKAALAWSMFTWSTLVFWPITSLRFLLERRQCLTPHLDHSLLNTIDLESPLPFQCVLPEGLLLLIFDFFYLLYYFCQKTVVILSTSESLLLVAFNSHRIPVKRLLGTFCALSKAQNILDNIITYL